MSAMHRPRSLCGRITLLQGGYRGEGRNVCATPGASVVPVFGNIVTFTGNRTPCIHTYLIGLRASQPDFIARPSRSETPAGRAHFTLFTVEVHAPDNEIQLLNHPPDPSSLPLATFHSTYHTRPKSVMPIKPNIRPTPDSTRWHPPCQRMFEKTTYKHAHTNICHATLTSCSVSANHVCSVYV